MTKKIFATCVLAIIAGVAGAQTYVTNTVPDGGFEPADPTYADTTSSPSQGGGMVISFPTSGGNPNGCAEINDNSGGTSWGVWVLGNATPIALTDMGLAPDTTYTFLMDMKTVAGLNAGGLKIESWGPSGKISDSGDMRNGSASSTWTTFSYTYHVAPGATGLKLVGLWGSASTNLYDNVRVAAIASIPLSATITSPANGASVNTNFSIAATAVVYPGTLTSVDFYQNTTLLGSSSTAPYSWNVSGAATGAAGLTVVAHDSNGNSATSAVVNVTITSIVPTNTFVVDPSQTWQTYMNVFETPQNSGGYDFGVYGWGTADLVAVFSGVGPSSQLTLEPAKLGDTNAYWYNYADPSYPIGTNGAVGNHDMEATKYVQVADGTINGNVVAFTGICLTNTLDINQNPSHTNLIGNGWTVFAFVKDLASDYSSFNSVTVPLTNGMPFQVSQQTIADTSRHIQYGFITRGPNVWPTDYTNYGQVAIQSLDASPTNVYVDSSATWVGYMNVFNKPQDGGGYQFGSGWGTADLSAVFNGFGLTLSPNSVNDTNAYWYSPMGGPGAVGNKTMDASMYVEIGSLPGRHLTFSGTVLSNTLVSAANSNALGNGWTCVAFIKDFAPDYSSFNQVTTPMTPGSFSLGMNTINDPNRHVQYGFETIGPDVWATDVAPFGNVIIANAGVLRPQITPSLSGGTFRLAFPTQLSHTYTVQYKTNLTDATWSTLTVTNGTGLTAIVPDGAGTTHRFYQLSIQ